MRIHFLPHCVLLTCSLKVPKLRVWLGKRRIRLDGYSHLPSFQRDIESGLTSSNFDLVVNNSGDTRKGLDENAKSKILKTMEDNPGLSFDEARLKYTREELSKNQIGPDGIPLDPKTVTFGK